MVDDTRAQWVWTDSDEYGIPDSVTAFWNAVRDQDYDGTVENGDLCIVYQHSNRRNGESFEDLILGRYDAAENTVESMLRASYGHLDVDMVTAEPEMQSHDLNTLQQDGYQVTAFDPGNSLRDGSEKPPIDIKNVPQDVLEQLQEHGTYYHKNGPDVLATDLWNDRLIRFHGPDPEQE